MLFRVSYNSVSNRTTPLLFSNTTLLSLGSLASVEGVLGVFTGVFSSLAPSSSLPNNNENLFQLIYTQVPQWSIQSELFAKLTNQTSGKGQIFANFSNTWCLVLI